MNAFEKVNSIAASLPGGVRSFTLDSRYWDPGSPFCPHDGWVQDLTIRETMTRADASDPTSRQDRQIRIVLILLGWSHENLLTFTYENVLQYRIQMDQLSRRGNRAHGDWLEDSFRLTAAGDVLHEIRFSSGAEWSIICRDISLLNTSLGESSQKFL